MPLTRSTASSARTTRCLLASNFSGTWPGLVALLNTGRLAGERRPARPRGSGPTPPTGPQTPASWNGSTSGARPAGSATTPASFTAPAAVRPEAIAVADRVADGIRRRRVLALMLGDTSMGMINGYFGPRLLYPIGFSEHKVDQAWLIERTQVGRRQARRRRIPVRPGPRRRLPLERARCRGLHAGRDPRAAPRLSGRARPAGRIPGRLPGLAVSARPAQAAAAQRFRRGPAQLARPARGQRPGRDHQHRGRPGQPGADGADEARARWPRACPRP